MQQGGKYINLWRAIRNKEVRDYKRALLKLKNRASAYFSR